MVLAAEPTVGGKVKVLGARREVVERRFLRGLSGHDYWVDRERVAKFRSNRIDLSKDRKKDAGNYNPESLKFATIDNGGNHYLLLFADCGPNTVKIFYLRRKQEGVMLVQELRKIEVRLVKYHVSCGVLPYHKIQKHCGHGRPQNFFRRGQNLQGKKSRPFFVAPDTYTKNFAFSRSFRPIMRPIMGVYNDKTGQATIRMNRQAVF